MADFPENKQKQLSSLNQDILAVKSRQEDESSPSEKLTGGAPRRERDSSAGAGERTRGSGSATNGAARAPARTSRAVVLTLPVLFVLIGALGFMQWQAQARTAAVEQQLAGLQQSLAGIEQQLAAADQEMEASDGSVQDNVLQLGSRVREMNRQLSRLTAQVGNLRTGQEDNAEVARQALEAARHQQQEVQALAGRVDGAGPAPEGVSESEFADLEARVERISSDIRSLYRVLESR